jgi:hypothetical protein
MGNCLSQPDPPTTSAHPHKSDVLVASSNSDPNENLAATRWNTPSTFLLKSPGHNTLLHTIITVSEKAGSNIGCKPGINPRTGRGKRSEKCRNSRGREGSGCRLPQNILSAGNRRYSAGFGGPEAGVKTGSDGRAFNWKRIVRSGPEDTSDGAKGGQ